MMILIFLLILFGMFVLYKSSAKSISKVKPAQTSYFIRYNRQLRILAFICFFISGALLCLQYGNSIGFVSWWIFATPITFGLILRINRVMQRNIK